MATSKSPEALKPYIFHGLELEYSGSDKEAIGDCCFCGKEGKFSVSIKKGTWRCLTCGESGNQYTFLEMLWAEGVDTNLDDLAEDRGLEVTTLEAWGVSKSVLTGQWLVPGYNTQGEIRQLYRYATMKGGVKKLLATPTITHQVHGVNLYKPDKQVLYLCEGPWDAMKLWEVLSSTKERGGKFVRTKSDRGTLIKGANVLAVPGCSTFHDSWKGLFLGKKVYIVYDNDYPKKHNGKMLPPAGYKGVQRVSGVLGTSTRETGFLKWGEEGYDEDLPDGTDVRDYLNGKRNLKSFLDKLEEVPEEWKQDPDEQKRALYPIDCKRWTIVNNQWKKALTWSFGFDTALSVMLASIVSTDISGDQLWVKIIGPASCAKSTLCEGVSISRNFVLAKSTIRGFHSGFKSDRDGSEDNSLINQVAGKTLVTKDGDTLLQSPNLGQILSEARDVYDRTSRTHYRNKMSKEYSGINMTWILCGTSSLRSIDSSELGERFLDCVIMDRIDDDYEDEVLRTVVRREDDNMSNKGKEDSKFLTKAMQLTGGYIEYLRKHDEELLANLKPTPEEHQTLLMRIGKFVSYMRARPSDLQKESADREFGARLASQHTRLAKCLAVVLNRKTVDQVVMKRVVKVALDTARGVTFSICSLLREEGSGGSDVSYLTAMTGQSDGDIRRLLKFLIQIGAVELFSEDRSKQGLRPKKKWRLTSKFVTLWNDVVNWEK